MHNTDLTLTKQIISAFDGLYLKFIERRHVKITRSTIAWNHPTSLQQLWNAQPSLILTTMTRKH